MRQRYTIEGSQASKLCLSMAMGLVSDVDFVHKFGANLDVGTGAFEIIETAGGTYPWPTTAEPVRIKAGGAAADAAAGAGARAITILGLDENWNLVSARLATNGIGASASTTASFTRVYRAYVDESGTYGGANSAAITIENETTNQVLATIAAGVGQTQMALYTVPADKQAALVGWQVDVDSAQPADVRFYQRPQADVIAAPFGPARLVMQLPGASLSHTSMGHAVPIVFDEKTDIWFEAKGQAGAAKIAAEFDLYLFDKDA